MASDLNKTYSSGLAPSLIKEYYDRSLLENMKPQLIHSMDSQKRTLPLNNGRTVKFRRFTPFGAITTPLAEGVTPKGQMLEETAFTASIKRYGGHVRITDEMQWIMLDDIHKETAQLLADQAALSIDTISRDEMNTGINVQYAGTATTRATAASQHLSYEDIKKAVRTLKRNNWKPCSDGYYHAIVHPDVVHDLTSDPMWIDVAKYQDKQMVANGELGIIYKVKFFESTNAKVFTKETNILDAITTYNEYTDQDITVYPAIATLTVSDFNKDTRQGKLSAAIADERAIQLAGKIVYNGGKVYCIERVDGDVITMRYVYGTETASNFTSLTAYASNDNVYSTLIYGANATGSVELGGTGKNIETIIKEPGSSGSNDPLNQRGSIAWVCKGFTTVILSDDGLIRLESGASA